MSFVSKNLTLKVWGELACFTRPEMKVERVSYDVITPSAARAIFEAILWKPAIQWVVVRIDVLNPIRWVSVRRNEIKSTISMANVKSAMKAGRGNLGVYVEEDRTQRAGLLLRDVAYLLHARFEMTKKAGEGDSPQKFLEMFLRRAEKGQCFIQPYLGCREFSAGFELANTAQPIDENKDLGWMLYDIDYQQAQPMPRFFRAALKQGSVFCDPHKVEIKG